MLSEIRGKITPLLEPLARAFARAGFTPNSLTLLGLTAGSAAALLFAEGEPRLAGLTLLVCGLFDVVDGAVARLTGGETAFGGLLDSVVDRYVDFAIFAGVIYGGLASWTWSIAALTGGFIVSYTRARAEAAGSGKLDVGIAERGERLLILALGGLFKLTDYAVALVATLAHVTAVHRLIIARRRLAR
ncbi:MAG: CDP-alcohol phosphatidyltransferase family protein [Candidatus Hodarchaeaceae archaeon]|nr:CDP-alcohol phosphatidyltransferase family protein [Candidatus Hodarchaeaceae archaeon]